MSVAVETDQKQEAMQTRGQRAGRLVWTYRIPTGKQADVAQDEKVTVSYQGRGGGGGRGQDDTGRDPKWEE